MNEQTKNICYGLKRLPVVFGAVTGSPIWTPCPTTGRPWCWPCAGMQFPSHLDGVGRLWLVDPDTKGEAGSNLQNLSKSNRTTTHWRTGRAENV